MVKKKKGGGALGSWAFLLGVVLALLFRFVSYPQYAWVLVVLGIVVGLLNITSSETFNFLLAGTALVIVGNFAGSALSEIAYLSSVFNNLVALFATSTIVVALKSVFEIARR